MKGLFNLCTPGDLVRKLEHDLQRMRAAPADARPAFDFVVTAYHLKDWLDPKVELREHRLLPVAGHLANSAKHFVTTKDWKQVSGTVRPLTRLSLMGTPEGADDELIVAFTDREARRLGRRSMTALELADELLRFWQTRVI